MRRMRSRIDGAGLDDGERACPVGPSAAQDDPEDTVGGPNARSPLRNEGGQLLAQGEVLEKKVTARAHGRSDGGREGYQQAKHEAAENRGAASNRQWFCGGPGCGEAQFSSASSRLVRKDDLAVPRMVRITLHTHRTLSTQDAGPQELSCGWSFRQAQLGARLIALRGRGLLHSLS